MNSLQGWHPSTVTRVIKVFDTSTKPILAMTDEGLAVVKYLGNAAGPDALISELIGTELARWLGLSTPDYAVIKLEQQIQLPTHPHLRILEGPAFCSRFIEGNVSLSPKSALLNKLRDKSVLAKLVVLDTWLRNKDRFTTSEHALEAIENYNNVLLRQDKRMVEMLVIDHSHAIAETTLEDELTQDWANEEIVYGLSGQFRPHISPKDIADALLKIAAVDRQTIHAICARVPHEWGMTAKLCDILTECIHTRAHKVGSWLTVAIFDQYELDV